LNSRTGSASAFRPSAAVGGEIEILDVQYFIYQSEGLGGGGTSEP
jgi:hypothetical protein